MKKLLLVALLMLALVITAVACNGNETVETTAGETTATQTPATAEPDDSTAAPETPTEAPTAAPENPTDAPDTQAPEVPTDAPVTQAPVVTTEPETEAPVDPMAPINVFEAADIQTITGGDPSNLTQDCVSIVDNYLHIVPIGADPYWYPFASVDGGRYVAIRYRTDATGADMQLYIASSGNGPSDDTTMIRLAVVADGEWHLAVFDTQSLIDAGKYDGEYVSYFRFDPLEAGYMLNEEGEPYKNEDGTWARHTLPEGCYIDVEYIAFFNSAEAAEKFGGDTPAEPEKYDNLTVPQDQWVITGHNTNLNDSSNPMVAAGGVDSAALLHQGSIYLGELDLSKYSKVVVMWGCDNSGVTQGHYDANANNRIMLLNAVMDGVMSPAEETIIAGGTYELGGWAVQAFEIDLTNVSYNGPVYVAIDALPGTFALFASVEFIGAEIPAAPETPDEPETPTVELTPFTEKFHANVDFINGGSKDGAGVPYQGLGSSLLNSDGSIVVRDAAADNIVVNDDYTINLQGWMAVTGGINRYVYSVNGGELITAVGGADGEPLEGYYAGFGMNDSLKNGLFNGGNMLVADLSAYAGQTVTVTFYAVPEAAQDTVAPIVSVEGLVVPAAAEEPDSTGITVDGDFADWADKVVTEIPVSKFIAWTGTAPEAFTLKTSFTSDGEYLYVYLNAGENSGATMYQICLIKDNTVASDAAQAWYNVTFADGVAAIAKASGAAVDGATVSMTGTEIEAAIPIAAIYGEGFALPVDTRILLVAQVNGDTHMGTFHDGKNPNDDGWADRTGDGCPLTLNADGSYTIDLPKAEEPEEPVENYNVPQDQWVVTGHCAGLVGKEGHANSGMVAAGGVDSGALLHQGAIALGEIDLSKYSKVVIMWGCDNSPVTIGHYEASANNRIMLVSADVNGTAPAEGTIIAGGTYELGGWAVKAFEIDLTGVDYNGPVYVCIDTLPGTFALFSSVEFIA